MPKQPTTQKTLFPIGNVVATPGALKALGESGEMPGKFIKRHQSGDWGDVCADDRQENNLSVEKGFRILSSYQTSNGIKLWVITEADRSVTTLLLPDEY